MIADTDPAGDHAERWFEAMGATGLPGPNRLASFIFAVDSGAKPILLSATMKTALILVVGKRVGKAV
ncbi:MULTISPECIES: hypothetical protein [Mesorhizobium]|uniref:hypothetical protein n=1 Tax=Mesorhizobium TaxID=68287 RepID=UPI000B833299|nr:MULTISPECIES: hypothetical protein [Mesorhizobium]MCF6102370.1 hypothetical protein [Mesorhizobium muleiense]RWO24773.1 MAG: hypothetical protein EOS09_13825 [Mesorhizobium sp.]RWO30235.1 MAG: hypothetical protein EOS10_20175 [Mesorhizobium sp.]RWO49064.1 MAG: hypothetical protein EOS11_03500 [Mesorhizobium sp.]RWO80248.1 MAG: hypothetical protein EOS18_13765 [Mesorhizobium sp.]